MDFNYTDDQRMALEFPGNVIVSAGAGSGKTRVLVEKYFRLLVDEHPEWPVDSIVAITFTRKAASELKSRIIGRILKELEKEPVETPRHARLQILRAEVGAAPIGTIHTFCGRILREFAFDARIDPDYMVVEDAQEGALRLNAARETIAEATAARGSEEYHDLLVLLNVFSAARLTEILSGMLAGRTNYLVPARNYVEQSVEELFSQLLAFHKDYADTLRDEIGREWMSVLSQLARDAQPGKVKELAEAALSRWPTNWVEDWSNCAEILKDILDGLFTKTGTCRKREFKHAGFDEADAICVALCALCEKLKSLRLETPDENDRADIELSRCLARLFLRAVEVYEHLRGGDGIDGEAQLVDFSDLEILAEKLISSSPDIRRQISARYPYLIIDEFQDTSQSQWNILRPLVVLEDGTLRPDSLFVVGDRKQGVYGFRDANVTLFSQVQNLVTASNAEWSGCDGAVTMAANFRTNPVPLGFINKVFHNLLSEATSAYSVEFEPLTPMKNEAEGCVEFLLSISGGLGGGEQSEEKMTAADRRACEARLVASHIRDQIDSGAAKPGDIALLFRKKSVFQDYELALREAGIPCITQQGDNLFRQTELADTVAALNAVVYPHKDMVLVHYLRSPFIGCTDDLLLKIARTHGRSFWDKANLVLTEKRHRLDGEWHSLSELELDRLAFALSVLKQTRQLVGTVPPYEVLRFMMDELGSRHTVLAGYRGHQAAANLDKLLSLARSAESLSFEEFLEYIKSEEESLKGTAEAVDLTTADAVRIMTIHAAKGLEFPVVYLPDLNSGVSGRGHDVYGDGERWMTIFPPREYSPDRSFLMDYFRMVARKQQEAEERRVFYVAMTRCESRLVLCASPDSQPRGETFYHWIADEFEMGKVKGLVKSESDFPENNNAALSLPPGSIGSKKPTQTRQVRIDAALATADVFSQSHKSPSEPVSPSSGCADIILEILPQFLATVWHNGTEAALAMAKEWIQGLEETAQAALMDHFGRIADWLLEEFSEAKSLDFSGKLRISCNGDIHTFEPHVIAEGRSGWIAIPGTPAELWERLVEDYNQVARFVNNAPTCQVWVVADDPLPVTS